MAVQEVGCLRDECREASGLPGSRGRERARSRHRWSAVSLGLPPRVPRAPARAQSWTEGPRRSGPRPETGSGSGRLKQL